jgi:hypothetical protein
VTAAIQSITESTAKTKLMKNQTNMKGNKA